MRKHTNRPSKRSSRQEEDSRLIHEELKTSPAIEEESQLLKSEGSKTIAVTSMEPEVYEEQYLTIVNPEEGNDAANDH